jgi:molecular chaperone DnaK (HSP70)
MITGRLAVDFGTSNTVLAVWDAEREEARTLHIPGFGRATFQGSEEISIVPSVIHYAGDGRRWIGQQVFERSLYNARRTFRWMKRYISHRSPMRVNFDGVEITPFQAGHDYLSTLLRFAAEELKIGEDEPIALSAPVEAFEHYENWLAGVAESAGLPSFRMIDEPSAAALGYGAHIQPGSVYLIFDFGGGTLHTSVVLMESEEGTVTGRRCRVLGKGGRAIGGTTIDQWIFEEVLRRAGRDDSDDEIRRISTQLLVASETVKERLSFDEQAYLRVVNPESGMEIAAEFNRSDLENILDERELYTEINRTIRSAVNSARERGYDEDSIQAVFMVGGSSQIPSVYRSIRQMFGADRVLYNRPLDAIARGAAAFAAGVDFFDHIQHDYAIRYVDPVKGEYDYRPIVKQGTPYPTDEPLAKLSIKASYDGQQQMGIAIFEIGRQNNTSVQPVELVFDPSGAARVVQVTAQEQETRANFWMNENNPTFLSAQPPVQRGEAQFEVEFQIDANKRLVITAREIKTGQLTHYQHPVVRLA